MGKIRVLDDHVVNRIAAGEVVERPASVVKELLENALDAGATSVGVRLEGGGRDRIEVADDGSGMGRDDALLALERHATSKLGDPPDLIRITTMGFRGEALPSIAAVSTVFLRTAETDGAGTEIEIRAGRIVAVRDVAMARGTTVIVARLFHNVPARRKFLRSEGTELAHVARVVSRFALCRPDVRFLLEHAGRALLEAPRGESAVERAAHVLGQIARGMSPFDRRVGDIRVHGLAGRPADASAKRDAQACFVNGRLVQDRVLHHAIGAAYENTTPRGQHAPFVLFVELPADAVDVNVHPQKAEVRFRAPTEVHDAVRDVVRGTLAGGRSIPAFSELLPARGAWRPVAVAEARALAFGPSGGRESAPAPVAEEPQATRSGVAPRALAQIRNSYILAEDPEGLVIVDQHAAHERVLFERLLGEAERGRASVQRLAFPVTVRLAAHEMPVFEDEIGELHRLGLDAAPFGPDTVRIDAIPAVADGIDPAELLRELLGEAASVRTSTAGVERLRHRLVTTASCKAAIKIRRRLTVAEMQALIDDLFAADNPGTCPHGRPTIFRLSVEEMERAFRRR
jgi:DNA mismatch repair protein MutL